MPKRVAKFVAMEVGMFTTLYKFLRPGRKTEASEFSYSKGSGALMGAATGLVLAESVATHLLVSNPAVAIPLAVVNAYGILWMSSMWAGMKVHKHQLSKTALNLRFSHLKNVEIPLDSIEDAHLDKCMSSEAWFKADEKGVFHAPVGGATNVRLKLNAPNDAVDGAETVRFAVNEPALFVEELRRRKQLATA